MGLAQQTVRHGTEYPTVQGGKHAWAQTLDIIAEPIIAEKIVQQAGGIWQDKQLIVGATAELGNAGGKCPSPVATSATHATVAKPAVGTKRREPSALQLLTAKGGLTDSVAMKAVVSRGTGEMAKSMLIVPSRSYSQANTASDPRQGVVQALGTARMQDRAVFDIEVGS